MGTTNEIDVQNLWEKYEEVAMHFNDLLIKLRTQALAGIPAVSALVGIFSKSDVSTQHMEWIVAQAIFLAMIAFWIALWCLDMLYYNRLLSGAVKAIIDLENKTNPDTQFNGHISLSSAIEAQFKRPIWSLKEPKYWGVVWFYGIVLAVLVAGFIFAHIRASA